ncbi:MAG: xylulokinase [Ruminococcaceae bacterium]|nr:xylulokinase [Oscillospiraceae bacterium]
MKYILGIDFGGGASKATLLREDGIIAATHTVEYPTSYPAPGMAEQNPMDWYIAAREDIAAVLKKSGIAPSDIAAVALDAATHTAVLCDRDWNILRPSIYWTDSRAIEEVAELKRDWGDFIYEHILHKPDTIWTLPQLMWVKRHEPELWAKVDKILFAKDFVRHMLTGDYVTDYIEAEGSMFFDYTTLSWSRELCALMDFDPAKLPAIVKPTDFTGTITAEAAADTGLLAGTPVVCGTTDTAMEVFAAGAVEKGQMTIKLATAGRICVITDRSYPDRNLINYSHIADGLWYPGTATKACASSLRWYRDTFGGDYRTIDEGAEKIPVGSEGLVFHPYINGELTPYADPKLCASFIGVRAAHTKAHFDRAVLEGVAMSMLDCKKALEAIGIEHSSKATIIGGGASSPLWRQIVADALGFTLVRNENSDSSFGMAMLAGTAVGIFPDFKSALAICNKVKDETLPNPDNAAAYEKLHARYKAVHDALAPIYDAQ